MIILGIESTAHTFGISIIDDKKVLVNKKKLFTTTQGGMIPAQVAEHHIEHFHEILTDALNVANVDHIDAVAYSSAPGLGHSLRIGATVAKTISLRLGIPIIPVNHCIAHLEIGRMMTGLTDPVLLYASGANTQIIAYQAGKFRIFGETLDIGVGNFLDSFGRSLNLGFPAGPKIEELAQLGRTEPLVILPYSVKGMDISLGGLQTKLNRILNDHTPEVLANSVQETVFAMLVEVAERAMAHCEKNELVLGGGVACNKRLQEMCRIMCQERGARFGVPANEYLVDNAAMIAWTGLLLLQQGKNVPVEKAGIDPYQRTDEV